MKKIGFIIFVTALVAGIVIANFTSIGSDVVRAPFSFILGSHIHGSGNLVTEKRKTGDFKAVDVGGNLNIEIVQSEKVSVTVEADDNILPAIKTEVYDGVLRIWSESKYKTSHSVAIRISAPSVEEIETSGVARATFTGINNESIRVNSSGASKVSLSGSINSLEVEMSGASKIYASKLKAERASIDGSGASSAEVEVVSYLSANLSGASGVSYKGDPAEIKKSVSGAANVSKVE